MKVEDGLYDVTNEQLSAGFAVYEGKVIWCAPILKRKLSYWMKVAKRIGPVPAEMIERIVGGQ